ncbi:MAG: hypothetical protein M1830_002250 [Pleopsidium flavum]|nr:MAG: hypothetical protein M1830_002250 [Pleopsidium flavum]
MLTSGFTNAPISRFLVLFVIAGSIIVSITDSKYLFYIQVVPHLWRYKQAWRLLVWQACFTNSTEVLFAAMSLYHLRIIERLWGSRKFASFLLSTLPYTTLLPPLLLALLLRPLTFNHINYLPAGPVAIIFSLLAQYHAVIPHVYKYRIATSTSTSTSTSPSSTSQQPPAGILFSDKSLTYLLATQLALSQFPGSTLSAAVGWFVGYAWRSEILPGAARWRVPGWMVGGKERGVEGRRYEGLRRRLEGEATAAASGVEGQVVGGEGGRQRRTLGTQILDQFRGAF